MALRIDSHLLNYIRNFRHWPFLIFFVIFFAVMGVRVPRIFSDLGGDASQYMILAESLAGGRGFTYINYPGEPQAGLAPLFPFLLSPVVACCGRNMFLLHFAVICCSAAALFIWYKLFSGFSARIIAAVAVFALALTGLFQTYTLRILTEMLFLLLCGLALQALDRYRSRDRVLCPEGVWAGICLVFLFLTRYVGLVMFAAAALGFLLSARDKRTFKKLFFLFCFFSVPVFFWLRHCSGIDNPFVHSFFDQLILVKGGYLPGRITVFSALRFIPLRVLTNIYFYFNVLGEGIFSSFVHGHIFAWARDPLYFIAVLAVLFGMRSMAREKQYLPVCFLLFYSIVLLFWPHREDGRYFLPVLPLSLYCFYRSVFEIWAERKTARILLIFSLGSIFLFHGAYFLSPARPLREAVPQVEDYFQINEWMGRNIPGPAIVFSRKPRLTFYLSGHKSIVFPFTYETESIEGEIARYNVSYVLADGLFRETYLFLRPFIYKNQDMLEPVKTIGTASLLKVRR